VHRLRKPISKQTNLSKPVIISDPANVTDVLLSQSEVRASCVSNYTTCNRIVEVATVAPDGPLKYVYVVTAGKIIGSGSRIKWDLSGVPPGTYTITAGVDEGHGVWGMTKTKVIKVIE